MASGSIQQSQQGCTQHETLYATVIVVGWSCVARYWGYVKNTRLMSNFINLKTTKALSFSSHLRDCKAIRKSLLHNFYICFILWHILIRNIKLSTILDIWRYAWYVTSGVTQFYFLTKKLLIWRITARTVSVSDFNTDWKGLKQYLIVGRYLGVALNGLFLVWRHQT